MFQFTLPCRERPSSDSGRRWAGVFQFTLPCRERPGALDGGLVVDDVSIHAPV